MKIKYNLSQAEYPSIPCVHDCVIREVRMEEDFLVFVFENNISQHDCIRHINPKAKSLVIKYHLVDDIDVFVWKRKLSLIKGSGYLAVDASRLLDMTKDRLEYLYHNVGYQSLILKLWSDGSSVIVDLTLDYVEYDWIE